jgi:hypothetical protein
MIDKNDVGMVAARLQSGVARMALGFLKHILKTCACCFVSTARRFRQQTLSMTLFQLLNWVACDVMMADGVNGAASTNVANMTADIPPFGRFRSRLGNRTSCRSRKGDDMEMPQSAHWPWVHQTQVRLGLRFRRFFISMIPENEPWVMVCQSLGS